MRVVLMGPPGAGKGTQAKRLAGTFDMVHLSSGDILRAERSSGSELGRRLTSYLDAGELVPDEIVVAVMAEAISSLSAANGLVLDGFPRTVPQAEALDRQLDAMGRPLEAVLVIDVPDSLLLERITGRRSCPKCGRAYHVKYLSPATPGRCDDCGTELTQRADDTEQVVRERLDVYRRQTEPVIAYYKGHRRPVMVVDGSAAPDEVTERVFRTLRARGSVSKEGRRGD